VRMKHHSRSHINLASNTSIINDPCHYTNSSDNNAMPLPAPLAKL
jgi:hypothetical protein